MLPLVPRWTANAAYLAAFTNDEPFITQQLDGMTVKPYGNPSNFLEVQNADEIPAYWLEYRYYNLIYYGGTYLDAGFAAFFPLKSAGLPTFPTAPIALRMVTFLAGLLSLSLLYNFARRSVGLGAALILISLIMTEPQFVYLATFIHPDMLQFFLTMLALVIGVRLARTGDVISTIALGVTLGLIQGTKSGAPFLLPMAFLALAWGVVTARAARPAPSGGLGTRLREALSAVAGMALKGGVMGVVAIAAFVASTPYLVFDPYYLSTTKAAFAILSGTSPLVPITFGSWYEAIASYLAWPLLAAMGAGAVLYLIRLFRGRVERELTLALVLGASNLLWFTGIGRFWVVLYYLLPALVAGGLLLGLLVQEAAERLTRVRRFAPAGRLLAGTLIACTAITLSCGGTRLPGLAETVASGVNPDRTPELRLNAWAIANVPHGSRILFDDEAYFDPASFPDQATNAGVIRYLDLYRKQPDFFVLTDYPGEANWIMIKRATQHFDTMSDDPYSVRLYQDLIDSSPSPYLPGPTQVTGITLAAVAGLPWFDKLDQPAWFRVFDAAYRHVDPGYAGIQRFRTTPYLAAQHRLLMFRVDPSFYSTDIPGVNAGRFRPISSEPATGTRAAYAFDGIGQVWLSAGLGEHVNGAFVGIDYGPRRELPIREVQVKWVAASWLPGQMLVQYSDDGKSWISAATFAPVAPPEVANAPGTKRWWATYDLPASGAHRYWRVMAADMRPDHYFGLDELVFRRTQSS